MDTRKITFWFVALGLLLVCPGESQTTQEKEFDVTGFLQKKVGGEEVHGLKENVGPRVRRLDLEISEVEVGYDHQRVPLLKDERAINKGIGIMQRIVDHLPARTNQRIGKWKFGLIPGQAAFGELTELGGCVCVGQEWMKKYSDDALAFIISHEISHVALEHKGKVNIGLSTHEKVFTLGGITLWFPEEKLTREQELTADRWAVRYMRMACFNPEGAVEFLKTLGWVSEIEGRIPTATAPPPSERIDVVKEEAQKPMIGKPLVTSGLQITPKISPYKVGQVITAEFTISNVGVGCLRFDVLTVGGRLNGGVGNKHPDFEHHKGIDLASHDSYKYIGKLKLEKPGNYDFFTTYKKEDGQWNTAIPTAPGVTNTEDIWVEEDTQGLPSTSCQNSSNLKGLQIDFTQWGWANPLHSEDMYISSGGCFLDPKYPRKDRRHIGVDLLRKSDGDITGRPVYSICKGKVIEKHITTVENSFIAVECSDGSCLIIYGHVKDPSDGALVGKGDEVQRGDKIAEIADYTTVSPGTPSHLHLGINTKGEYYFYGTKGWGRVKSYESDEKIAEKGWVDAILYLCENPFGISPGSLSGAFATSLVIDKSGSMAGKKIRKAKESAYCYVDTCAEGDDLVSLVTFHSRADANIPPVSIAKGRKTLESGILSVGAGGSTNIGSGLAVAHDHLSSCNTKNKVAVLMTDGQHNTGTYKPEVGEFIKSGWPIYTVGFGTDADMQTLERIAQETGGLWSWGDIPDLQGIYTRIKVHAHNGSVDRAYTDFIRPGHTLAYDMPVNPGSKKAGCYVHWQGSRMETTLTSPRGQVLNRNNFHQLGRFREEQTYTFFEIDNPQPGNWQVQIVGHDLPPQGEQINFQSFSYSDVFSNILSFQPAYSNNQKVRVAVKLAEVIDDQLRPMKGAYVNAEIKKPSVHLKNLILGRRTVNLMDIITTISNQTREIELFDDGQHGDVNPGDGIYANTYNDTATNGPYVVSVYVEGHSRGRRFDRIIEESFQVGKIEQNSFTISDFLGLINKQDTGSQIQQPKSKTQEPKTEEVMKSLLDQLLKK